MNFRKIATRKSIITLVFTAAAHLLCASLARASEDHQTQFELTVCNEGDTNATLSLVHRDWYATDQQILSGWHSISRQSCKAIGRFPRGEFFVYAKSETTRKDWSGEDMFACVSPRRTERVIYPNESCVVGEQRVGFFSATAPHATFRLRLN